MDNPKHLKAKILDGLTMNERLELVTRALEGFAHEFGTMTVLFSELLENLQIIIKMLEKEAWATAIREEIHRREDLNLTKAKAKHLYKGRPDRLWH